METLDLRNLACPEPVIRTKRAIEANPNSVLTVLLNHPASRENVARMARSLGAQVEEAETDDGEFTLTVTTPEAESPQTAEPQPEMAECTVPAGGARPTVLVKNDVMGLGNDELGRILMKAFLKTLREADPLPACLIFINAGVHLTTEGSEEIAALAQLAERGVEIVSCGTCLDYYDKLDAVQVGLVGNMFDIVDRLVRAPKVIAP
ncbi:MAG: sulfurtransferase-like selenium metabolism protein YedF [Planctomycetota bacterium]